ncbi:SPFH domain-containing protein [Collinsella sp. zg1085]|uniref:SPFH domain-containing protein n=1 Tax=Collinsella sp. zg1085 TaxID=2844380 RepID=UPI001C0E5C3F|nr:SPFH domain-containing protein [Collinsella sp. zg1085]QWT17853.1 SPFH domain-containing protein [Collinsella sp. zg1085]
MSQEKTLTARSGWTMVPIVFSLMAGSVALAIWVVSMLIGIEEGGSTPSGYIALLLVGIIGFIVSLFLLAGFITVQPGQAQVCILFGTYMGTIRQTGFFWANPFYSGHLNNPDVDLSGLADGSTSVSHKNISTKVSLRARTLNGEHLKVNDKMGNPIEIATVVVWRVTDTAKALFDVDDYLSYVAMQTETALRHVASIYAYDHMEDDDAANTSITLRSDIEQVSQSLKDELDHRLSAAGVTVDDARLTHLAYAPEIAPAMLRRQQAEAVIAARKKIVEGAVSMVDMAVRQLSEESTIELDDERKAAMASNLLVVLCGESEAQPIVNTGSLY